jgi:hypothetical protein
LNAPAGAAIGNEAAISRRSNPAFQLSSLFRYTTSSGLVFCAL